MSETLERYDQGLADGEKWAVENPTASDAEVDTRFELLRANKAASWSYRQGFYHGVQMERNDQELLDL